MIENHSITWLYERVDGLEDLIRHSPFFQNVFLNGGYIAGGFPRKLIEDGSIANISEFFTAASDIDVFFESVGTYETTKFALTAQFGINWEDTPGHRAIFSHLRPENDPILCALAKTSPAIQLINCQHSDPKTMIEGFDFANCKIAFNETHVWIDSRVEKLERERILVMDRVSVALPRRLSKYKNKHKYRTLDDKTKKFVFQWIDENIEKVFNADDWEAHDWENKMKMLLRKSP